MVFKQGGRIYSISDMNENGEYVVVKLNGKTNNIEAAKIVIADSKEHVKKIVKRFSFNKFKDLPINGVQEEDNMIQ